jgi:hypothetical protein
MPWQIKNIDQNNGGHKMESIIINREMLSEVIISYIHSEKIKIFEENGNIILSPIQEETNLHGLSEIIGDGELSTEKFIERKTIQKNCPENFFELFGAIKDDTFSEPDDIDPIIAYYRNRNHL